MEIKATFGVDVTPLQRGLTQAEQSAKASAAKVSAALNSVQATAEKIGRRPTFRPFGQQQFDDFLGRQGPRSAANLPPARRGQYPKPMDEDEGLARRAIAAGGLLTVLHAVAGAFTRANEEAGKLAQTITRLTAPNGAAGFRSQGSIQSNLSGITSTLDQIRERDLTESQGGAKTPAMTLGHLVKRGRQLLTGGSDQFDEEQKNRLRQKAVNEISALADKQRDLNRVTSEGSEREMALMKEQIQHREKLGELAAMEAATGVQNRAARDQEVERSRLASAAIQDAADQREREATLAARMAALVTSGLTADQQRTTLLKEQIAAIDQQLTKTRLLTQEQKTNLQTQRVGTQNELYREQYANRFDGDAMYTPEKGAARQFADWVEKQQATSPDAYKTHPDAYTRSPDAYNGPDDKWMAGGKPYVSQLNKGADSGAGGDSTNGKGSGSDNSVLTDIKSGIDALNEKWE